MTAGSLFLLPCSNSSAEEGKETLQPRKIIVKSIEIRGNKKIETTTILGKLDLREGDLYSSDTVRNGIKKVFQQGYFEDVRFETEGFEGGVKIVVIVKEKATLRDVFYQGNEKITSDKLKEKVFIKKGIFIDLAQAKSYQEKLVQYYQGEGYYSAEIIPVLERADQIQVNLIFLINEGPKTFIKAISFSGNHDISDKELKKKMELKDYFWLTSWMTDRGIYKADEAQNDAERIKENYLNNGYVTAQVSPPEVTLSPDRKWFFVKYAIHEGPQFKLKEVSIKNNTLFTASEIKEKLKTQEGQIFRKDVLRQDISALTDLYGEKGHAYFNVIPQLSPPDMENKTVNVELDLAEGSKAVIRKINIVGNEKTRDKVIRREVRLNEGEIFNNKAIRRSYERIRNLNYFDNVELTPQKVSDDPSNSLMDLNIKVKEKSTGQVSLGGGYSSVDHLIGMFEISEGNFLGNGWLLKTKAQIGGRSTMYDITFREPYLNDKEVSGSINLFRQEMNFITYSERRLGGSLSIGKALGEYVSGNASYTLQYLDLLNVVASAAPRILTMSTYGQAVTSTLGAGISRDTRDYFFDPSKGSKMSLSFSYSGPELGGNLFYYKAVADASSYFPLDVSRYLPFLPDLVFSLHGQAGMIGDMSDGNATLFEGFVVGGINTVRGFEYGKAGSVGPVGDIILANKEVIFNAELLFPIVKDVNLKGVVFFDAGRGFDVGEPVRLDALRSSAGFGFRWVIPNLGPIRFEWGYNLHPLPWEATSRFDFSIGSVF